MGGKNYKNQNGITLIALVVTIVVLLILAGITITALFSENGIIKKAQEAKNETERDQADTEGGLTNLAGDLNNILNEYGVGVSGEGEDNTEINASAIATAEDKSQYYGKTVNYTAGNQSSLGDVTWQIFYAGKDFSTDNKDHIYLIASDYVPNANLPKTKGNTTTSLSKNGTYKAYCSETALGDYYNSTTSTVTMNSLYQTLNKSHYDYLVANNSGSYRNVENMKAVAYMLDIDAWAEFAGGKAEYAIGGPTVEMLMASYNQTHGNVRTSDNKPQYQAKVTTTRPFNGYQISQDYGDNWANGYSSMIVRKDETDTLYINDNTSNIASGYWLASPSAHSSDRVEVVPCNGYVGGYECSTNYFAFRPVVSLTSNVQLKTGTKSDETDFVIIK